jgi:hypothetical protein
MGHQPHGGQGEGLRQVRLLGDGLTSETCSILLRQRDSLAEGGAGLTWAGSRTWRTPSAPHLVKTGSSWEKYPSNMLFAWAISSGVPIHCPYSTATSSTLRRNVVGKHFGKAERCEIDPSHTGRFEWSNISGKYLRQRSDWRQLCASCHSDRRLR